MSVNDIELGEVFWSKVDRRGADECWEWMAGKNRAGYGRFHFEGEPQLAHRLAVGLRAREVGCACHTCDNPGCVNPHHLYVGNYVTNAADRVERNPPDRWGPDTSRHVDETLVWVIRWLSLMGYGTRRIARIVDKDDRGWISRIVNGHRWPKGPWPNRNDDNHRLTAMALGLPIQQAPKQVN